MINFQVKDALETIIQRTYGEVKPYSIELIYRPTKINDNYDSATGNLKLYNLGRSPKFILLGALMQMSKHVSLSNYGTYEEGSEEYNKICHTLISEGIRQGYLDHDTIQFPNKKMQKLIEATGGFDDIKCNDDIDQRYTLQVKNCYDYKDNIKTMGFRWNKDALSWEKTVKDYNEASDYEAKILALDSSIIVIKRQITDMNIELYAYVQVYGKGTFNCCEHLKSHGYKYKAHNLNGWSKRVLFTEVPAEREFLAAFEGITLKVKTN